jgi:hypothetical protein
LIAINANPRQPGEDGAMIIRVVLYVLASWLIAAHFLREFAFAPMALCLAAPLLFFIRRSWSALLLQGLAYVAAIGWLATAWQIAEARRNFGEPWVRAAAILIGVAAFTALAGLLLNSAGVRARYRRR